MDKNLKIKVKNYITGEICEIFPVSPGTNLSDFDYKTIQKINNEPIIYNTLHREKFDNESYSLDRAKGWVRKQKERWQNKSKYNFLVRNSKNKIIAAIDLSPLNTNSVEVGYWASQYSPGIMTNTVIAICGVAKQFGFKEVIGKVSINNEKSQNVLIKAGFKKIFEKQHQGVTFLQFSKNL